MIKFYRKIALDFVVNYSHYNFCGGLALGKMTTYVNKETNTDFPDYEILNSLKKEEETSQEEPPKKKVYLYGQNQSKMIWRINLIERFPNGINEDATVIFKTFQLLCYVVLFYCGFWFTSYILFLYLSCKQISTKKCKEWLGSQNSLYTVFSCCKYK